MSKNKFVTAVIVLLLVVITVMIVKYLNNRNRSLVNPGVGQTAAQAQTPMPVSNPPPEIKYDSSTDLRKELDSIDPQIDDNDFE